MIRVKDPKASLDFYTRVLGMTLIAESKNEGFTLYFLAFAEEGKTLEELKASRFNREGVVELTHNWGTETDPDFKGYASGNDEPGRGFGHLCITCADVDAACARFEELGCRWKKRLTDGRVRLLCALPLVTADADVAARLPSLVQMRNIAFLLDPDGCVLPDGGSRSQQLMLTAAPGSLSSLSLKLLGRGRRPEPRRLMGRTKVDEEEMRCSPERARSSLPWGREQVERSGPSPCLRELRSVCHGRSLAVSERRMPSE